MTQNSSQIIFDYIYDVIATNVKWRENVILAKNVNFYKKLHSSELKLYISTSKNQLNIFTADQYIIYAQTVKMLFWFFDVLMF